MKDIEKLLTLLKANITLNEYYEDLAKRTGYMYNDKEKLLFIQNQLTALSEDRNSLIQNLKTKYNEGLQKLI